MKICAYFDFAYFCLFCKAFGPLCKTWQVLHDSNAFDPAISTNAGMELFLLFFLVWYSWFVSCRTGPLTYDKWLITIIDLKDLSDVLLRQISSTNCCKIDFWTGKPVPAVELAFYKQATENSKEFMTVCKTKDAYQKFLDLLAQDHCYLTICNSLESHQHELTRETTLPRNHSCLSRGLKLFLALDNNAMSVFMGNVLLICSCSCEVEPKLASAGNLQNWNMHFYAQIWNNYAWIYTK